MSVKTNTCNIVSKKFTSHNCRSYDTATYHAIAVAGYFTIKPDKKKFIGCRYMTQLLTLPQMLQVISQPNLIKRLQIMTIADPTTDITSDLTTKPDQKVADNDTIADLPQVLQVISQPNLIKRLQIMTQLLTYHRCYKRSHNQTWSKGCRYMPQLLTQPKMLQTMSQPSLKRLKYTHCQWLKSWWQKKITVFLNVFLVGAQIWRKIWSRGSFCARQL